jgi:hypothetical protein
VKLRLAVGRESSESLQVEATDFQGDARVTVLARGEVVASFECPDPPCHGLAWIGGFPSWALKDHFYVVVENEGRTTEVEFGIGRSREWES